MSWQFKPSSSKKYTKWGSLLFLSFFLVLIFPFKVVPTPQLEEVSWQEVTSPYSSPYSHPSFHSSSYVPESTDAIVANCNTLKGGGGTVQTGLVPQQKWQSWAPFCDAVRSYQKEGKKHKNEESKADKTKNKENIIQSNVNTYLLIDKYLQPYEIKLKNNYFNLKNWSFLPTLEEVKNHFKSRLYGLYQGGYRYYTYLKNKAGGKSFKGERSLFPVGSPQSLFTGYYSPQLEGNLEKTDVYNVPLHARPKGLVSLQLADFIHEEAPATAMPKILRGHVVDGFLKPYYTHAEINQGALKGNAEDSSEGSPKTNPKARPLVWLKSVVDKFFLQVQGSGEVLLPNGQSLYVGYDGDNGHPYTAIGRYLIEKGHLKRAEVTLQSIRKWLQNHPQERAKVLHQNKRYIFFKVLAATKTKGSYGTQQTLLVANQSLAVDPAFIPLGAFVYLNSVQSLNGKPFRRILVAQDTGSAIKGPIRGDIYFGKGKKAEALAGAQKAQGRLFVLLPKENSVTQ